MWYLFIRAYYCTQYLERRENLRVNHVKRNPTKTRSNILKISAAICLCIYVVTGLGVVAIRHTNGF